MPDASFDICIDDDICGAGEGLEQNIARTVGRNCNAIRRTGTIVQSYRAICRSQHDRARIGRHKIALQSVSCCHQRIIGLHFLSRDGDVVHRQAVAFQNVDATAACSCRQGGNRRLDRIAASSRRADSQSCL